MIVLGHRNQRYSYRFWLDGVPEREAGVYTIADPNVSPKRLRFPDGSQLSHLGLGELRSGALGFVFRRRGTGESVSVTFRSSACESL
jgi:hypothetical protein